MVDLHAAAAAAERCVDKVDHVEETIYEDHEVCHHSYDTKCHQTYTTEYDSVQEEECDDEYRKQCHITYSPQAHNETVEVCARPLIKVGLYINKFASSWNVVTL